MLVLEIVGGIILGLIALAIIVLVLGVVIFNSIKNSIF